MRLFLFIFCLFFFCNLHAQDQLRLGYYVNPSLNLYQRTHLPNSTLTDGSDRSSGQLFNILPDLSVGLWIGQAKNWTLGLEAGFGYHPFSFNVQNYNGLGSFQIPLMLRTFLPLKSQHSSAIHMNIATGIQINKTQLYFQPNNSLTSESVNFHTYLLEISGGLAAISQKATQIRGVDLFFRFGFGASQSLSFKTGLRVHFWNSFKQ
jgi:hypothetical protein